MKLADQVFTFPDKGIRRSRLSHMVHLFVLDFLVVSLSLLAVFYSLGYKLNPTTHTIQQTGLIWITSALDRTPGIVTLEGVQVSTELPYRSAPLFPGTYEVTISREGYQSWTRTITVQPNKVSSFRFVTLTLTNPLSTTPEDSDQKFLLDSSPDIRGIKVNANELRVNDVYITRFSQDIVSAQWYPDHGHVAYQIGNQLWLLELTSRQTQLLATLSSSDLAEFRFKDKGRVVVYKDGDLIKAVELYTN